MTRTGSTILEDYGFLQMGLRSRFGWETVGDYGFPNIRNIYGAIAFILAYGQRLYPTLGLGLLNLALVLLKR